MNHSVIIKIYTILLLSLLFLKSQSLYNGVGHIPTDKQADWTNAGLQFLLPVYADKIITINNISGPDDSEVSAALIEARDFNKQNMLKNYESYVIIYFPEGNYVLNNPISLNYNDHNRIIFQGDGPSSVLNFNVGNNNPCFYLHGTAGSEIETPKNTILDFHDNELLINDVSGFKAGDWIHFYEWDHPDLHEQGGYHASLDVVGQINQIDSVNSSSLILRYPASKTFDYNIKAKKVQPIHNIGIENLKIKRIDTGHNSNGSNISFSYAVNCWVHGVEFEKTCESHISIGRSSNIKIFGCYFNDANYHGEGGFGYGVTIGSSSTRCLVENNIFRKLRHSMILGSGANTNVIIYNYSREVEWTHNSTAPDLCLHGNMPFSNLFEHNWVVNIEADPNFNPHGPYNAFVRNKSEDENGIRLWMHLENAPSTSVLGCELRFNISNSVPIITVGNTTLIEDMYGIMIETSPPHNTYETGIIIDHKTLTSNLLIKPYLNLLDISYFYSARPYFLDNSYTFPSIGPNSSQNIPAKDRYNNTIMTYVVSDMLTKPPSSIIIDQKDAYGNSFGLVSHWEEPIWKDYQVIPNTPNFLWKNTSQQILKADININSNQKFNNWNNNFFLNYNTFTIYENLIQIIAYHEPIEQVTIKYNLLDDKQIQLKDPWLRDYNEAPYGIRNQGMSAPFISYSSPHNVTISSAHQGVFLNQGYNEATNSWNPPYYSVKAQATQQTTEHGQTVDWYFQGWGGDNVGFKNPENLETAVVFKNAGAVAKAYYKGHFVSSNNDAYSSNSQRKLVRTDTGGKYHIFYTDKSVNTSTGDEHTKIFTSASANAFNGSWSHEIDITECGLFNHLYPYAKYPLPSGLTDFCSPSVSENDDEVFIVFEAKDKDNAYICYGDYNAFETVVSLPLSSYGSSQPVIGVGNSPYVFIAWKTSSGYKFKVLKRVYNSGTWTWDWLSTSAQNIQNTSSSSTNLTLVGVKSSSYSNCFYMAWQDGVNGPIRYQKYKQISDTQHSWSEYFNVSSGSGMDKNKYPSIALYNNIRPIITWQGSIRDRHWDYPLISRVRSVSGWGSFHIVNDDIRKSVVNATTGSDHKAVIAYVMKNGNNRYIIYSGDNSSYSSPAALNPAGTDIHLSNAVNINDIKAVTFNNSISLPYMLHKSTMSLSKEAQTILYTSVRRGVITKGDMEFVFEIGDVMLDGRNIQFKEFPDSISINTLHDLNNITRTKDMDLDKSSELLFSHKYYVVNEDKADKLLSEKDEVKFRVELVRSSDDYVCGVVKEMIYNKNNVDAFEIKDFKLDCSGLKADKYYLRLKTSVKGETEYYMGSGLNGSETLGKKEYEDLEVAGVSMPVTYELAQNYPNPFNPVTTISYAIPNAERVEITVYDIRGRIVQKLLDTYKEPGRYTVKFDGKQLSSGLYIYRLKSGDYITQRKMLLVK